MMAAQQQPHRIVPGCAYALRDLQSAPAWNGSKVIVLEYRNEQDRYIVRPAPEGSSASSQQPQLPPTLAVRAANLGPLDGPRQAPISASACDSSSVGGNSSSHGSSMYDDPHHQLQGLAPGTHCALHGLNAAVFNGQHVVVIQYLEDQHRYQVRPVFASSGGEGGGGHSQLPAIMAVKPTNLRLLEDAAPPHEPGLGAPAAATSTSTATSTGGAPPRALKKQGSKRKVFSLFRKKSKDAAHSDADDTETVVATPTPSPPTSPVPMAFPHPQEGAVVVPVPMAGHPDMSAPSPYPFRAPVTEPQLPPLTFGGPVNGGGGGHRGALTSRMPSREHMFQMSQSVPNLKLDTIIEGDDTRHSRDMDESNPNPNPPQPQTTRPTQFGVQNQLQQQQPVRPGLPPRMGGLTRMSSVPSLPSDNSTSRMEPRPARRFSGSSMSSAHSGTVMEPRLASGSVAKLTGLTHQSFLNDLVVVVLDYSDPHGRYRVKIRGGSDEPAAAAVNGKDLMIHRRNLLPLAVSSGNSDDTSKEDDSSASKAAALPVPAPSSVSYKAGDRLSVTGLGLRPSLNGALVEVLDYDAFTQLYQVRPVHGAGREPGEVLNVRHDNLTPLRLADGTRVVLTHVPGKPLLDGELGTVAYYQKEKGAYRVRLLGATALDRNHGMELLDVPLRSARAAPPSAMWVNMALHGESLRVPLSCHVENGALYAKLDVFAGVDRVVPTATLLYGEDKCDWLNDEEVTAFVKEMTPFTLKCCMSSSGAATARFQSNCPFLEPMVEYELLQATGKVNCFKLLFDVDDADEDDDTSSKIDETATVATTESDEPIEVEDSRAREGKSDDEEEEDDDDDDDDENPFLSASPSHTKRVESPAERSSTMEPPASQEPPKEPLDTSLTLTDVFKAVEYELVDEEDETEAAPTPPQPVPTPSQSASKPTRRPDPEEVVKVTPLSEPAEDPPRAHRVPTDASVATPRRARSELSQSGHSARSREASPSNRRPDPPGRQSHEAPVEYYKHLIQQRGRELESTRVGRAAELDRHRDGTTERPRARSSSRVAKKKKKCRSSSKARSRSRSVTRSDFSLLSIPMLPIGSR